MHEGLRVKEYDDGGKNDGNDAFPRFFFLYERFLFK